MYHGNDFPVNVVSHAWETGIRLQFVRHTIRFSPGNKKAYQYFIQKFDATNFSERNTKQTE